MCVCTPPGLAGHVARPLRSWPRTPPRMQRARGHCSATDQATDQAGRTQYPRTARKEQRQGLGDLTKLGWVSCRRHGRRTRGGCPWGLSSAWGPRDPGSFRPRGTGGSLYEVVGAQSCTTHHSCPRSTGHNSGCDERPHRPVPAREEVRTSWRKAADWTGEHGASPDSAQGISPLSSPGPRAALRPPSAGPLLPVLTHLPARHPPTSRTSLL